MRLTLSNGRTFIIKVRYRTEDKAKFSKDQYGRTISVTWQEHNTVVAIGEILERADMSTVYKGYAYCSYKDTFSKKTGREIAYYNAITNMLKAGVITESESHEMDVFALNKWVQDNTKTEETNKETN